MTSSSPIRIAVVDDCEIVHSGVAALLEPFAADVRLVVPRDDPPTAAEVDVVLFDPHDSPRRIDRLVELAGSVTTLVFTWLAEGDDLRATLQAGAAGKVSKTATGPELVRAVRAAYDGSSAASPDPATGGRSLSVVPPGGLSAREAEVLGLVAEGLSNRDIAEKCYLSINTVKTYIRTGYRKIGVTRRAQAVAWVLQHDPRSSVVLVTAEDGRPPIGHG